MGKVYLLIKEKKHFSLKRFSFAILILLPVFSNQVFFLSAGLVGYNYEGAEESSIFVLYTVFTFLLSALVYATHSVLSSVTSKELLLFLFLSIFLATSYFLSLVKAESFEVLELAYFAVLSLPGVFSGLVFYKMYFRKMVTDYFKYFKFVIMTLACLFIFAVIRIVAGAESFADLALGGASYQFISYTASLFFGMVLYVLYYELSNGRSEKLSLYNVVLVLLLLPLAILVFLTGSKGAALLLVIYATLFGFIFLAKKTFSFFIFAIVFALSIALVIVNLSETSILNIGIERIVLIFDSDSSLNTRSSGRIEYYVNFVQLIKDSPLIGYGPFTNNGYVTNSHNFFTMVMLNFGILIGSVFLAINFILLINFFNTFKFQNLLYGLPFILLLFLIVSLSFSGSYLKSPIYWFVFAVLFCMINIKTDTKSIH